MGWWNIGTMEQIQWKAEHGNIRQNQYTTNIEHSTETRMYFITGDISIKLIAISLIYNLLNWEVIGMKIMIQEWSSMGEGILY